MGQRPTRRNHPDVGRPQLQRRFEPSSTDLGRPERFGLRSAMFPTHPARDATPGGVGTLQEANDDTDVDQEPRRPSGSGPQDGLRGSAWRHSRARDSGAGSSNPPDPRPAWSCHGRMGSRDHCCRGSGGRTHCRHHERSRAISLAEGDLALHLSGCRQVLGSQSADGTMTKNQVRGRSRFGERGMVTAELAVATLAAGAMLIMLSWGVFVMTVQLRCIDSAAEVARQMARGDRAAVSDAKDRALEGAAFETANSPELVTVKVRVGVRPFVFRSGIASTNKSRLPTVSLTAQARVVPEPGTS